MQLLIFISLFIAAYCIIACLLRIPKFSISSTTNKLYQQRQKVNPLKTIIDVLSKNIAVCLPLSPLHESKLQKALSSAAIPITPRQHIANSLISTIPFLAIGVGLLLYKPIISILPFAGGIYIFIVKKNEASKAGNKRKFAIEKELPRFTSYIASSIKYNRNIIEIINIYKQNYKTELTKELAIVIGDMKTGNQERALMRMETRVNSVHLSEVVRGLISFIRGDNMTMYFDTLSHKLSSLWQQRLREQALKKEPKITRLSYLLTATSLATIFYVLAMLLINIS